MSLLKSFISLMFSKLLSKIFESKKPKFRIEPEHQIEFVFEFNGVKYYRFTNEFNIPVLRAMAAQDIYNEMEMNVDREYLDFHIASCKESLNKGNLVGVASALEVLASRLKRVNSVDLMYKLASVLYFDENENMYDYDYAYNQNKIKSWKEKSKDIDSFFLRTPMKEYLPYSGSLEGNLESFTLIERKESLKALEYLLSLADSKDTGNELLTSLKQQITELQNLIS